MRQFIAAFLMLFVLFSVAACDSPMYSSADKFGLPPTINADIMDLWVGGAEASQHGSLSGDAAGVGLLGFGFGTGQIKGFLDANYSEKPMWVSLRFYWPNGRVGLADVRVPRALLIQYANQASIPLDVTVVTNVQSSKSVQGMSFGKSAELVGIILSIAATQERVAAVFGEGNPNEWKKMYPWDGSMQSEWEK